MVVDSDGTGTNAKTEVNKLKKGVSKINGVSNVEVTTSGRPNVGSGAFTGGEIFGIIVGIVVACCLFGFIYKRYDLEYYVLNARQTITPTGRTDNPVYQSDNEELGIPTINDDTSSSVIQVDENNYHSSKAIDTEAGVRNLVFEGDETVSLSEASDDPITAAGVVNQNYESTQEVTEFTDDGDNKTEAVNEVNDLI